MKKFKGTFWGDELNIFDKISNITVAVIVTLGCIIIAQLIAAQPLFA